MTFLCSQDVSVEHDHRLKAIETGATEKFFNLVAGTWSDTVIYGAGAAWLAFKEGQRKPIKAPPAPNPAPAKAKGKAAGKKKAAEEDEDDEGGKKHKLDDPDPAPAAKKQKVRTLHPNQLLRRKNPHLRMRASASSAWMQRSTRL